MANGVGVAPAVVDFDGVDTVCMYNGHERMGWDGTATSLEYVVSQLDP